MITYLERKPHPALADFVKCYWYLEKNYRVAPPEVILPDGCLDIVLHFGSPLQHAPTNGFLIGQLRQPLLLTSAGMTRIYGIRFYAYGLYPFIHIPLRELTEQITALADFMQAPSLAEKIATQSVDEAFAELEQTLMHMLNAKRLDVEPIQAATRLLYQRQGAVSVPDLADFSNLSKRSLERKFADIIGFSPKSLARIMRFNRLRNELMFNPAVNLTDLTYRYHYYDQAHFIHEFEQFAGSSPSTFADKVRAGEIYFYK